MKNSFGQSVCLTLFGESHGAAVGCVIDGLAPGIKIDEDFIARQLTRRRPSSAIDTPRREKDEFKIISGAFDGKTTGTPLCIVIPNENTRSSDYDYGPARPSHADYSAYCKYHGYEDFRGGGHFSGRITAALVAAGGVLIPALEGIGISLATHIYKCAGVSDRAFGEDLAGDIKALSEQSFPVLDDTSGEEMTRRITTTNNNGGVNGGITNGMPIVFRCAVKPTPSIARPQDTVDFIKNENTRLSIHGRHDPAIIRRICPVLDSVAALCIADMLSARYGTDVLTKGADER